MSQKHFCNSHLPGLALSAGGARGAYQMGCWKAFLEHDISFGAVAGSSIGALNSALICQGDWEKANRLWLDLTRPDALRIDYKRLGKLAAAAAADVGMFFLPVPNIKAAKIIKYASAVAKIASPVGSLGVLLNEGLFSLLNLRPILEAHIDMKKLMAGKVPVFITVFGNPGPRSPAGSPQWFKLQEQSEDDAWNLIIASMALPIMFAPVSFKNESFIDGGIGHWLPVQPLRTHGVRKMVAVSTKPGIELKSTEFPDCAITLIGPEKHLGRFPVATFKFTESAVWEWMEKGYEDARLSLKNAGAYTNAFSNG